MQHYIISLVGTDYVGSADDSIEALALAGAHSINAIEARSIAGHFLVNAHVVANNATLFEEVATDLLKDRHPQLIPIEPREEALPSGSGIFVGELTGFDRDGLVRPSLNAIRSWEVDVISIRGVRTETPFEGSPLFLLEVRMQLPEGFPIAKFCESMERVSEELGLVWDFTQAGSADDCESAGDRCERLAEPNRLLGHFHNN